MFGRLVDNHHIAIADDARTLDRINPPLSMIVPFGETPAALYVWAVVGRGMLRRMIHPVARALGPNYYAAPVYAFLATESGRKAGTGVGFSPAGNSAQAHIGELIKMPPWTARRAA